MARLPRRSAQREGGLVRQGTAASTGKPAPVKLLVLTFRQEYSVTHARQFFYNIFTPF